MPDSNVFTFSTSAACWVGDRLRWTTPIPPSCAITIAVRASVTVSMAEEITGIASSMVLVRRVAVSVSAARTSV